MLTVPLTIAIHKIKFYMDMLTGGRSSTCHAKAHLNLELVLSWRGKVNLERLQARLH